MYDTSICLISNFYAHIFFYSTAATFPDNFCKCKFRVYAIFGGFYITMVKNRCFKKRDYSNGGLAYVQLVQIDLFIVYREISQWCFDPDVRTFDEMRRMLVTRTRNNTCSTYSYIQYINVNYVYYVQFSWVRLVMCMERTHVRRSWRRTSCYLRSRR